MVEIRAAIRDDVQRLAEIWFDGWQDAHSELLPTALRKARTLASFADRALSALSNTSVAEVDGVVAGFVMLKRDELYQFYVSSSARGTNVAPALMSHALDRLRLEKVPRAWLACAIGNEHAARFYEKNRWRRVGTMTSVLPTADGDVLLEVWRYEFELAVPALRAG
ncbi:ribosomal protein S18 acetylase RimI-like enzyme [Sphingomonas sp. UYAg733]